MTGTTDTAHQRISRRFSETLNELTARYLNQDRSVNVQLKQIEHESQLDLEGSGHARALAYLINPDWDQWWMGEAEKAAVLTLKLWANHQRARRLNGRAHSSHSGAVPFFTAVSRITNSSEQRTRRDSHQRRINAALNNVEIDGLAVHLMSFSRRLGPITAPVNYLALFWDLQRWQRWDQQDHIVARWRRDSVIIPTRPSHTTPKEKKQ